MTRDPLCWLDDEIERLDQQHLRRELQVRNGPQRPATIDLNGREFINFGSNDYLGIAATDLSMAVKAAIDQRGWGSGASPLVTGRGVLHAELERQLAIFEGVEATLLFPSGFAANMGTIAALVGRDDVIFSDAKNHASIIDGCRLSGARIEVYPHGDVSHLAELLRRSGRFRRRLIVTDSLFSMDGDLAPLPQLAELAEEFHAMLMVDEAHATGVFGQNGRGVCEHFGVEQAVAVRVGTLSKALGSIGGFVAGQRRLIDWLLNRARPYVFSTAAPEATAAAGLRALEIVRTEPQRRKTLLEISCQVRQQLQDQGWETGAATSQIIPVYVGTPHAATAFGDELRKRGILVPAIRPPTVPPGESLLRISLSCVHQGQPVEQLLESFGQLRN